MIRKTLTKNTGAAEQTEAAGDENTNVDTSQDDEGKRHNTRDKVQEKGRFRRIEIKKRKEVDGERFEVRRRIR